MGWVGFRLEYIFAIWPANPNPTQPNYFHYTPPIEPKPDLSIKGSDLDFQLDY